MGVSNARDGSDLLMTILVRKVGAVDIASNWIKEGWWTRKGLSRPRQKVASVKYYT